MNTVGSVESQDCVLSEQIARQVFDILPEDGPVVVIVNKKGSCWPSNAEGFGKLGITDGFIKELCAKVDDGDEPVITQVNDFSVVVTALATERTNCGYIIIALPHYSPEGLSSALAVVDNEACQLACK
jgi:hypothetical protein